jgi:uncharacterized membrane protein
MDVNKIWVAVALIGAVVAAIFFLPVLIRLLQVGKQGAERIQELDASNAATQEIAKSGGRTGLAITIGFLAFAIPVTVVLWVQTGHSFISYPLIQVTIGLLNWFASLLGFQPIIVTP